MNVDWNDASAAAFADKRVKHPTLPAQAIDRVGGQLGKHRIPIRAMTRRIGDIFLVELHLLGLPSQRSVQQNRGTLMSANRHF